VRLYLWDNEHVSEATVEGLVARSDRMVSEEKIGVFGVRVRGSEDFLGFCGFVRLEGMEELELWYELTQKVWGRGIATQAVHACVRYAFEEVGMERELRSIPPDFPQPEGQRYAPVAESTARWNP